METVIDIKRNIFLYTKKMNYQEIIVYAVLREWNKYWNTYYII